MVVKRSDVADAIITEAAVMFTEGIPFTVNGEDVGGYDLEWVDPYTYRLIIQGRSYKVQVTSER